MALLFCRLRHRLALGVPGMRVGATLQKRLHERGMALACRKVQQCLALIEPTILRGRYHYAFAVDELKKLVGLARERELVRVGHALAAKGSLRTFPLLVAPA